MKSLNLLTSFKKEMHHFGLKMLALKNINVLLSHPALPSSLSHPSLLLRSAPFLRPYRRWFEAEEAAGRSRAAEGERSLKWTKKVFCDI